MMYVVKESYVTALLALMALGRYTPTPWTEIFTHTHTHTPSLCWSTAADDTAILLLATYSENTHTPKLCSL